MLLKGLESKEKEFEEKDVIWNALGDQMQAPSDEMRSSTPQKAKLEKQVGHSFDGDTKVVDISENVDKSKTKLEVRH